MFRRLDAVSDGLELVAPGNFSRPNVDVDRVGVLDDSLVVGDRGDVLVPPEVRRQPESGLSADDEEAMIPRHRFGVLTRGAPERG